MTIKYSKIAKFSTIIISRKLPCKSSENYMRMLKKELYSISKNVCNSRKICVAIDSF